MIDVATLLDENDALETSRFNDINLLVPGLREPVRRLWQALNADANAGNCPHLWGIFETWRSGTRQLKLFAEGTTKTHFSAHNVGMAVDIVPVDKDTGRWFWERSDDGVTARWERLDDFVHRVPLLRKPIAWDRPHIEHRDWPAVRSFMK